MSDVRILHFTDITVELPIISRILRESHANLAQLSAGEAIICANETSLGSSKPILVKIRQRVSKHGGATKTAMR
jgi:hypothetical protein